MSPVQDRGFDRIGLPAYKAASLAAQNLPEPVTSFAASMLGAGFGAGMRARRSMIERHLRRGSTRRCAAPRCARAAQAAFDYYARYWVESFRLPGLTAEEVDGGFSYDGFEHVDDALGRRPRRDRRPAPPGRLGVGRSLARRPGDRRHRRRRAARPAGALRVVRRRSAAPSA